MANYSHAENESRDTRAAISASASISTSRRYCWAPFILLGEREVNCSSTTRSGEKLKPVLPEVGIKREGVF
jgi:hypothetical protein